ncbi:hypothetical protein FCM35_KLT03949 [Carex littledalei]|uniref:Uncharacterized protein n=1 Tax=Carex littledalei TaxID=544730 RepID=A0A833QQ98_9POAL|nr:hypothetical protein FCM35_KLT03949 [Carex littledalei]
MVKSISSTSDSSSTSPGRHPTLHDASPVASLLGRLPIRVPIWGIRRGKRFRVVGSAKERRETGNPISIHLHNSHFPLSSLNPLSLSGNRIACPHMDLPFNMF